MCLSSTWRDTGTARPVLPGSVRSRSASLLRSASQIMWRDQSILLWNSHSLSMTSHLVPAQPRRESQRISPGPLAASPVSSPTPCPLLSSAEISWADVPPAHCCPPSPHSPKHCPSSSSVSSPISEMFNDNTSMVQIFHDWKYFKAWGSYSK